VGSGLILLVIVGAWLAVLVPMALRSHDSASSSRTADRFSDAMRVLSRRSGPTDRTVLLPRPGAALSGVTPFEPEAPVPHSASHPCLAVRRRRTLVALLTGTAVCAVAGLVGPPVLLVVAGLLGVLAVLFVVHCRRQALLRAERLRRRPARAPLPGTAALPGTAMLPGQAPTAAQDAARVAGIPARMPSRPEPLRVPLPAPAARYDEPVPVHVPAAAGPAWQPVPVPLPTYVGKDVAPPRPHRVLDLTRAGSWSAGLDPEDALLHDDGYELDAILDRRRVVGGW